MNFLDLSAFETLTNLVRHYAGTALISFAAY
jgi:ATPase subunit of ABC transporter with duplicated ATPase domains